MKDEKRSGMDRKNECEDGKCENIDFLRLQVKEMLQPLEMTLGILADRWKSAGVWGKGFGTLIIVLLGWGVMVLGDLNTTLRDFGIIAHENKQEMKDFKGSVKKEHDVFSSRLYEVEWITEAMWITLPKEDRKKLAESFNKQEKRK